MKSVRLDPERAVRLADAARGQGISQAEFIRRAIDLALATSASPQRSLAEDLADVIGLVGGEGGSPVEGVADRADDAFTGRLLAKHRAIQR